MSLNDHAQILLNRRALAAVLFGKFLPPLPPAFVAHQDMCRRGALRCALARPMARKWQTDDPNPKELQDILQVILETARTSPTMH